MHYDPFYGTNTFGIQLMLRIFEFRMLLRRATIVAAAFQLAACGGVVYKDAATTYVVAGHAATKSIQDASTALAAAQDGRKAVRIAADPTCPIGEPRIFLRDKDASRELKAALFRMPVMQESPDCRGILDCDMNPHLRACASVCYSGPEANCIASIEENTAISQKSLSGPDAERFSEATKPLAAALVKIEYGRVTPVQNVLVKESLEALDEYLDLLDKLGAKRTSDVEAGAKKLSDKLTGATTKIASITGSKLSDSQKATQTQIGSAITALGKVADDFTVLAANARDADAISKLVNERSANVETLIESIRELTVGDAMLASVFRNSALRQIRSDLQTRFATSTDAYERRVLLAERDKLPYADGHQATETVNKLFDAMENSHKALIRLVQDPNDKDQQALTNARFQEFKLIAQDVAALVKLFL